MSFGGAVSAMAASLKNNARAKRKTYFDRNNANSKSEKGKGNDLFKKKVTPEQLSKIRNKMIKENRKERIKILIIIGILTTLTITLLLLFNCQILL